MLSRYHYQIPISYIPFKHNLTLIGDQAALFDLGRDIFSELDLSGRNKALKQEFLNMLILNLINGYKAGLYFSISRDDKYYSNIPARYKPAYLKYSIVIEVLDKMFNEDYLLYERASYNQTTGIGIQSRYAASDKLIAKLSNCSNFTVVEDLPKESIVLHGSNGKKIGYVDTANTNLMRNEVQQYNVLRSKSTLTLDNVPADLFMDYKHELILSGLIPNIYIIPAVNNSHSGLILKPTYLKRVFNCSFSQGGRFYCGAESMLKKEFRPYIHINGQPTCEIDFKAMHIRMLYHRMKIDYRKDPYLIDDLRDIYKVVALTLVNAKTRLDAIKGIRKKLVDEELHKQINKLTDDNISKLLDRFEKKHCKINNDFYSSPAIDLMYLDSQIANAVIKHFTKKGVVCLCVHDSFIVPVRYRKELIQEMRAAYKAEIGFKPVVK